MNAIEQENTKNYYPGDLVTPSEIWQLASEFRSAAHELRQFGRRGAPLSYAPFRLTAIHSIELYLNAFLLHNGHDTASLRSIQHRMSERLDWASGVGLKLRQRTAQHLCSLDENREYLVTRYAPGLAVNLSQITRLAATLDEVAAKVSAALPE